jgi:site-specific DNA-cytosine methylase
MNRLKAIDLCGGAGGWACAAAGLPIDIVLAVDFWEPACKTYELNHPATKVLCDDVRSAAVRAAIKAVGSVDAVLGAVPCNWLSSYRVLCKVEAIEQADQREVLDAVLAIVKHIAPEFWCIEDVKQLARELPIFTPWEEINARHFSAQRRKRIFVGEFPRPPKQVCDRLLRDAVLPGPYRIGRRAFGRTPQQSRTFTSSTTLGALLDRKAPTVTGQCSRRDAEMVVVDPAMPGGIRNFEWQEMALLQGFPRDYLFYGSPTDVMKQVGGAVQIDTARAILTAMVKAAANKPQPTRKRRRELAEVVA